MLKKSLSPFIINNISKAQFKKIIFLDRDGVINRFPGMGSYVIRLKDFHLIPEALNGIKRLNDAGFEVNVISNQGCVSHKLITLRTLRQITRRMLMETKKAGGEIQGVFYCPHQTSDQCLCRKPKIMLFKKALRGRRFDLSHVFFIGDSKEDMEAAQNLGCQALLVLSGRTKKKDLESFVPKPDAVKRNLLEAVRWITQKKY